MPSATNVCQFAVSGLGRPRDDVHAATVAAMPRILRSQLPDGTFHVFVRGVDGTAIVRDREDREAWVRLLHRTARRYSWRIHIWCLLTNHFHLVVDATQPRLSA